MVLFYFFHRSPPCFLYYYTELYIFLHVSTFTCLGLWGTWYLSVLLFQGGLLVSEVQRDQHLCFPSAQVSNQECVGKAVSESPKSPGCGVGVDHNSSELDQQWPSMCSPGLHVPLCFSNSMVWHKALHLFEPQFSRL